MSGNRMMTIAWALAWALACALAWALAPQGGGSGPPGPPYTAVHCLYHEWIEKQQQGQQGLS